MWIVIQWVWVETALLTSLQVTPSRRSSDCWEQQRDKSKVLRTGSALVALGQLPPQRSRY